MNKNLEKLVNHSSTLVHQSTWTKWKDTTIPVDLSWKSLIFIRTPKLLSFFLNSCIDATPTRSMLHLWGYNVPASCKLCNHRSGTQFHVHGNCEIALKSKRYTWRHDSVLATIQPLLLKTISTHNLNLPEHQKSIKFISNTGKTITYNPFCVKKNVYALTLLIGKCLLILIMSNCLSSGYMPHF